MRKEIYVRTQTYLHWYARVFGYMHFGGNNWHMNYILYNFSVKHTIRYEPK